MSRRFRVPFTVCLVAALVVAACVATRAASNGGLVDIGAGLRGPSGLSAAVIARGLANVSALVVDQEGRLWAGTAAFDDAGTDEVALVPTDGGAPEPVLTGLHTVLGLVWLDDELFVASKE